jgi:hypothetical protein
VPGETAFCNAGNWSTAMRDLEINISSNTQKFNINLTAVNPYTYSTVYAGFTNNANGTSTGHFLANSWNLSANPLSNGTFTIVRNFTGQQAVRFLTTHGAGIFWNESQGKRNVTYDFEIYACTESTC